MIKQIKRQMNPRKGNVFIEDRQDNESYEEPNEEEGQENNEHNINDEEIGQLLEDEHQQTEEEMVLKFKVNQLQKICNSLTNTNRKLIQKVSLLEEGRRDDSGSEILVDEYSELNGQITEVESLIHEYKQSLEQFQASVLTDMKGKEEKINKLKSQLKQLGSKHNQLQTQKEDIEKLNKQLETRNEGLILEIENLEKEKQKLEERVSTTRHSNQGYGVKYEQNRQVMDFELPAQIQNQYEILIQKLVRELEHEKTMRRKMGDQVKRMSQELMESEREIMSKNKKLYEIQMKILRNNKATADVSYARSPPDDTKLTPGLSPKYGNGNRERSDNKLNLKSFVLLELINGELEDAVSNAERKIVGVKLVEFYERKLERQDYASIMPENLLVCNFSHRKPELLSIRKTGAGGYEQSERTRESMVQNLAFILDNLFREVGSPEFEEILQLTAQVLEKQVGGTRECVLCMKQILWA